MSSWVLFLYLLKATLTTFSGLASVPVVRQDLVVHRHVITDQQLNTAVVITRTTPGPVGLYLVSVGYFAGGIPGAVAAWLAMIAPALLVIALLGLVGRRATHPRWRSVIQATILASAGLLWVSSLELSRAAVRDPVTTGIALVTVGLLVMRKLESLWIILGAAAVELAVASLRVVGGL